MAVKEVVKLASTQEDLNDMISLKNGVTQSLKVLSLHDVSSYAHMSIRRCDIE